MTRTTIPGPGFVLSELLVAGLIATLLMLGVVQMAAATSRSLSLIEALSATQQGGRLAIDRIRHASMAAGFHPSPWQEGADLTGLSPASMDGGAGASDELVMQQYSDRNCYDNFNSVLDGNGRPAFFLRVEKFERTTASNLAHTCHYGPAGGALVRQINREGLVTGVESFQVLYAEDRDGDHQADRRVRGGRWTNIENVIGLDIALLVASADSPGDGAEMTLMVLDEVVTAPGDGRLRRVWTATIPLGAKLR